MERKLFKLFKCCIICALTMFASLAFGQTVNDVTGTGEVIDFNQYFVTFAAFIGIVPFIVEAIKAAFGNKLPAWLNLVISWATGFLVAVGAHFLNLGVFGEFNIWQTLVTGFGAALATNGVFDSGLVVAILKLIIPGYKKAKGDKENS